MKVIIAGDRNLKDYSLIDKAVKQSGFKVTTVISGCCQGADALGEEWAKRHGIKIERYPADWNDLTHPEAIISVNKWGRKYNKAAGGIRNAKMAEVGDALIAIQIFGPTSGTQDMIRKAKKANLKIHVYEKEDSEYEYQF